MIRNMHEVWYELVNGPGMELLHTAWRWRNGFPGKNIHEEPAVVTFTIHDGVGNVPQVFRVEGLRWAPESSQNSVEIEVTFANIHTLGRWKGIYDYRGHYGWIASEQGQQPLSTLNCSSTEGIKSLADNGVESIAELTRLTELEAIRQVGAYNNHLNPPRPSRSSIHRFLPILASVKDLGLRFRGPQHTIEELHALTL